MSLKYLITSVGYTYLWALGQKQLKTTVALYLWYRFWLHINTCRLFNAKYYSFIQTHTQTPTHIHIHIYIYIYIYIHIFFLLVQYKKKVNTSKYKGPLGDLFLSYFERKKVIEKNKKTPKIYIPFTSWRLYIMSETRVEEKWITSKELLQLTFLF